MFTRIHIPVAITHTITSMSVCSASTAIFSVIQFAKNAKNTAYIIQLVAHVSAVLPPPGAQAPLPELVEKCYALGTFPSLWAVEGLGHWYADSFYERKETPQELLVGKRAEGLPDKSLTMLHAGIGMSFAKRNFENLTPQSPPTDIRKAAETVLALCKNSSQEGYRGAAVESLGLATGFLQGPRMVRAVDAQLAELDPSSAEYLWRGAGRAMYFSPPNFVPGFLTPWRAVEMCRREPPHEMGRRNAIAGFAWAMTVVNMRSPIIMETVLKYHGEEFLQDDAFPNGVMSSLIMRHDITPDDPVVDAFGQYRPSDPKLGRLWDRLVKGPFDVALNRYYPVLKKHRRLDEVFRYQDLGALVERIEKS